MFQTILNLHYSWRFRICFLKILIKSLKGVFIFIPPCFKLNVSFQFNNLSNFNIKIAKIEINKRKMFILKHFLFFVLFYRRYFWCRSHKTVGIQCIETYKKYYSTLYICWFTHFHVKMYCSIFKTVVRLWYTYTVLPFDNTKAFLLSNIFSQWLEPLQVSNCLLICIFYYFSYSTNNPTAVWNVGKWFDLFHYTI